MARGIAFDTYQPQAPSTSAPKTKFAGDRRTAPGPEIEPCCECGDTIGPHWGDAGEVFCRRCASDELKFPGRPT